jgi:hypothetical protein
MNAQIFNALDGLESKLTALLSSLTTSPTAASAPAAAVALLEADDAVSSALNTLRTHQANYARILRLRAEAESLEERIKSTVRDIAGIGKEIAITTGDDDDDDKTDTETDTDSDSESEGEDERDDGQMKGTQHAQGWQTRHGRKRKEVDYRLLLDFARRISKYNKQAAADATAGAGARPVKQLEGGEQDGDAEMRDVNGDVHGAGPDESVAAVTKEAAQWLDESADQARQVYMIPYPSEDRIRMGLMGQLQLAAVEGQVDPEKEAERMVQEAEGTGVAGGIPDVEEAGIKRELANEAANAAAQIGSTVVEGAPAPAGRVMRGPAPAPKPRATLDLDLYDPDDDDV